MRTRRVAAAGAISLSSQHLRTKKSLTSMRQCPPSLPFCLLFCPCLSPILLVSPHRKRQSSVRHMSDDSRALLKVSAPTSVMQLSESQRTLRRGANLWVMKASVSTCRQPTTCHVSCVLLFMCPLFFHVSAQCHVSSFLYIRRHIL